MVDAHCQICGYSTDPPDPQDLGEVRGNTTRFSGQMFHLWKCPRCLTIHGLDPVDYHDIYRDYALLNRRLDLFARGTLRNLTRRLKRAGLRKSHSILDFGCGNGIYLEYLKRKGFEAVAGYDPFVPAYAQLPRGPFDFVVNNDTIEHCDDVRGTIQTCVDLVRGGGILYLGTADSEPVDMQHLEPEQMRLHQPFHRTILTQRSLHRLADEFGLECVGHYRRSYHDTLMPFANYRFLNELNGAVGHNLDLALDPAAATRAVKSSPRLWFFALCGYFFPCAYEPAVVLRKPS